MREKMGAVKLELRSPQNVNGIAADPQPDWSFDNLLLELESIDNKLNVTSNFPEAFTKKQPRELRASKNKYGSARGFVMHVPDYESVYSDGDSEEDADNSSMVYGRRFVCDERYMRFVFDFKIINRRKSAILVIISSYLSILILWYLHFVFVMSSLSIPTPSIKPKNKQRKQK